jgi:N-acetylglucosaminyldiphosphoundecaprenol N-acetyl-beta-D-mannosaminyltransferase
MPLQVHTGSAAIRVIDFALAVALANLAAPIFIGFAWSGRLVALELRGQGGRLFTAYRWQAGCGRMARLARGIGMESWPLLLSVLRGDLSWCGPRALPAGAEPPAELRASRDAVRPGVFSLWGLRQRTGIAYGNEWTADHEQVARPGLCAHTGLLLRSVLAAAYGRNSAPASGRTLVDTVRVHSLGMEEALDRIAGHAIGADGELMQVAFVNPDCVNIARRDSRYRAILNGAALVLADGIGMRLAGRLLSRPFPENVNGTDLFPRLCERLAVEGSSIYLLGARPGVAAEVAAWAGERHPGLHIAGWRDGYFDDAESPAVAAAIRAAQPDVLLVAMGAPLQEEWVATYGKATGARVAIGVGGLFDFYGGRIVRAPLWLRELGMEWIWRLLQEPGRMWRRYLVGNFFFMGAVLLQRLLGSADLVLTAPVEPAPQPGAPRRAVVVALSELSEPSMRAGGVLPALLPLGDRTLLERCLESLAAVGCRTIDIIADARVSEIRALVAGGERWGIALEVHTVSGLAAASKRLALIARSGEDSSWLVKADAWLTAGALPQMAGDTVVLDSDTDESAWTGWAQLATGRLATAGSALLAANPGANGGIELRAMRSAEPAFRFTSPQSVLAAQARWLERSEHPLDPMPSVADGLRISRGAFIDPNAILVAPLEIHPGAVIASGASVGPNVVVGSGAVVGSKATVRDALLAPNTYLGPGAELAGGLITAEGLLSARWNSWLPGRLTAGAAGPLASPGGSEPAFAERGLAALLLVALLVPAGGLALLGRRTRLGGLVAALPGVVAGRRPLVGVSRRDRWPDSIVAAGWLPALTIELPGAVAPSGLPALRPMGAEAAAWAEVHWLLDRSWKERLRILAAASRGLLDPLAELGQEPFATAQLGEAA